MTQRELADRIPKWMGWDGSTVAKIETGRRSIQLAEFIELAKALKLDPGTLLTRITNWR